MTLPSLILAAILSLRGAPPVARAEVIASDIVAVCADEATPFEGPAAAGACELLVLSVAYSETGLAPADETCQRRGAAGEVGSTQVLPRNLSPWTVVEVCGSRQLQYRVALRVIGKAREVCGPSLTAILGSYNRGPCGTTPYAVRVSGLFETLRHRVGIEITRTPEGRWVADRDGIEVP